MENERIYFLKNNKLVKSFFAHKNFLFIITYCLCVGELKKKSPIFNAKQPGVRLCYVCWTARVFAEKSKIERIWELFLCLTRKSLSFAGFIKYNMYKIHFPSEHSISLQKSCLSDAIKVDFSGWFSFGKLL